MPARIALTESRIRAAKRPPSGRVYLSDQRQPALQVCLSSTGTTSFYLVRRIDGRPTRVFLGRWPELTVEAARKAAAAVLGDIAAGHNPHAARIKARDAFTLEALFEQWLTHAKSRKKTWADDERQFTRYFEPLRKKGLRSITAAAVIGWHAHIGEVNGKTQANRCLFLLSTLMNYAIDKLEALEVNPCRKVDRFPEQSRERFLLPEEMKAFFTAVAAEEPLWRDFFLICLLTGARRGNVASMVWSELDMGRAIWLIPAVKTKNGRPYALPLSPPAMAVLQSRLGGRGVSPWVFPSDRTDGRIIDPRKAWRRVLERSKIKGLRMHDLRRSLGSWQAVLGASLSIIGASLGHADLESTQIYSRLTLDPVRRSVANAAEEMLAAAGVTIGENGVEPTKEAK